MANVKISQLPALTSITGTDVLPIVSGNTTYNVTAANIAAYTTGNVTFSDITIQGVNGLNLSAGPDFTANLAYLQVRAGDQASHIHLDTGDNSTYDLLVGNDQKYVQIGLGGNISISSYGNTGQHIWNFDTPGNLSLPTNGNIDFNGGGIVQTPNQDFTVTVQDPTNDDSYAVASVVVDGSGAPYTQTRLQSGGFSVSTNIDTSTYTWNFDSVGILTIPGNIQGSSGNSTSFYAIDDGSAGSVELKTISFAGATLGSNVTVRQSNVTISTGNNGNTWTFDNSGVLTLPNDGMIQSVNNNINISTGVYSWTFDNLGYFRGGNLSILSGNGLATAASIIEDNGSLNVLANGTGGTTQVGWLSNTYSGLGETAIMIFNEVGNTGNAIIRTGNTLASNYSWAFGNDGNLTLPGNTFTVNYANGTPVTLGGSSVAEAPFTIITNDFNATAGSRYGVDTTGGGWIATLPASPASGDAVFFADAGGAYSTNPFVVNPGLNTIMGAGGSMTVTTNGQSFGLFWNGTTWRTYN